MSEPVLAFAAARLPLAEEGGGPGSGQVTAPISLALAPGSLVVVDAQGVAGTVALADAAVGLVAPLAGQVRFQGQDWQAMTAAAADAARGQVGRCLAGGGWLPHLPVMENVTFAARHHRLLPDRVIDSHAAQLARQFGLPGVPMALPIAMSRADLARASLVRAFLGRPPLVVLEEPRRDLDHAITAPLVQAIRRVRDRGGAVLWLTIGGAIAEPALPADARYRLAGGRLIPLRIEGLAA